MTTDTAQVTSRAVRSSQPGRLVVDWLSTTDREKTGTSICCCCSRPRPSDDPWGFGRSLEWATSCPPPRHNFVSLPRIRSESPAFGLHHPQYAPVGPAPAPSTAGPGPS